MSNQSFPPLLVIIGQTAVGKTELSLQLAERFHGEIVSADSRLFYKGFDIGTAKPTRDELDRVPHHFVDHCEPQETLTLGTYQEAAFATIDAIHARNQMPLLVGGTGQYIKAVVEGWGVPRVPPQPALRQALEALGQPECARWLKLLDPTAAERLDPRNLRRVVRALEVTLVSGIPISVLQKKSPPPYSILQLGLYRERDSLYQRIDQRVDLMVANGLVDEVAKLVEIGVKWEWPAMSGLGYRQLRPYFDGEQSLEEAVERIKFETHRFARQQNTWFRRDDPNIMWLDAEAYHLVEFATREVDAWLQNLDRR